MRHLIARVFNLDLVLVPFAFGYECRFVCWSADGVPYVRLYGHIEVLRETKYGKPVIWVHRKGKA